MTEAYDWDKGLSQLNSQVDAKQLLYGAELLAQIEENMDNLLTTSKYSKEVEEFLSTHEALLRAAVNALLHDYNDNVGTYEYRGNFMALGVSKRGKFSYSLGYFPAQPEKAGKIYITINDMGQNSLTVITKILPLRPPLQEN